MSASDFNVNVNHPGASHARREAKPIFNTSSTIIKIFLVFWWRRRMRRELDQQRPEFARPSQPYMLYIPGHYVEHKGCSRKEGR